MFRICRQLRPSNDSFLQDLNPCSIHNLPIAFICLEKNQKCMDNRLLCIQCLQAHKTHDWESLQKYFDENFRNAVATGRSQISDDVDDLADNAITELDRFRAKINKKIEQINSDMRYDMKELKQKYPIKGKFEISGKPLNNKTAQEFVETRERQKSSQWTKHSSNFIVRMLRQTSNMISNLLDDFHITLTAQDWEEMTEQSSQKTINQFLKRYEGKFIDQSHYFKFSLNQHHGGIRVGAEGLQAKFVKASPSKPAALCQKQMTRWHSTVYFQVLKLQKTILVFDKQLVAIGVCIPKTAKTYGYRGIIQAAHGGIMIGSNGKCYHTRLAKYDKSEAKFTFGGDDIIKVQIDFDAKMIIFEKLTGLFKNKFEMELGIDDQDIACLKPCVMFDGEDGANVTLLEAHETTAKYQKKKKKQRKLDKQKN